ncbi:MAG: hypothetical protein AABY18_05145 [Candidatus Thermoplasmatota archaeon]
MRVLPVALVGLLALALVPAAQAQAHEHGTGPVRLETHLADPTVTYVGSMNGFTALALGDDEVPDFHQDLPMRITLDGSIVFESNADSGHDYDGVQTVWVVFGRPGAFKVEVLGEEGTAAATLEGTVGSLPEGVFGYSWSGGIGFPFGGGEVEVEDEGAFDAWADVRSGARLVSTATLHTDDGTLGWAYIPPGLSVPQPAPLLFAARPEANETRPALVVASFAAFPTVGSGGPDAAALALYAQGAALMPTDSNAVVDVTGAGLRLVGTYDPWTRVGTETMQNLAILGLRPDGSLVDDLRLEAALLSGRSGVVWSSSDILERDGIWEFASIQAEPGLYVLHAEASSSAGTASIDMPYLVTPPAEPAGTGPIKLEVAVPDDLRAGEPTEITVTVKDALGAPFDHSEVLLDVYGPFTDQGGMVVGDQVVRPSAYTLRAKLHTHADGVMRVTYAFPVSGNYTLWLSPSSLEARPVAIGGAPLSFAAKAVTVEVLAAPVAPGGDGQDTPGLAAPLAMLALLGLALAARRRSLP